MAIIDSDAHVIETDRTWDYLGESERIFKPVAVRGPNTRGVDTDYWIIDGRLIFKGPAGDDVSRPLREMEDIPGRLRHMDELETDLQVLFPTLFLRPITNRPQVELALYKSYNRWLADIWAEGDNRLRWAVALPMMSMDAALEELEFAKEHGACAVFMRGLELDRLPSDPYFFPLYERASHLDIPICVHAAVGSFAVHDLLPDDTGIWRFVLPGILSFHNVISQGIPDRFPRLRFGFIELSSQWVPYLIHDAERRFGKQGKHLKPDLLRSDRLFVACQSDDDLPYVLRYAGEDNLVMGTDYGHKDSFSELAALHKLRNMPEVGPIVAGKILDENARALYGLKG